MARIDEEEGLVIIDYDGRRVEYENDELDDVSLAYATGVRRSQGSEYPTVVVPLGMQRYMLLERNLLYPAVTPGQAAGGGDRPDQVRWIEDRGEKIKDRKHCVR